MPGQSSSVDQCTVVPPRVRTVEAAGSTATTLSRIQEHPSGTTSRIHRPPGRVLSSGVARR
jgi:hypothetical protein